MTELKRIKREREAARAAEQNTKDIQITKMHVICYTTDQQLMNGRTKAEREQIKDILLAHFGANNENYLSAHEKTAYASINKYIQEVGL